MSSPPWPEPYRSAAEPSESASSQHAVIGFDDSDSSHHALAYAIGWARRIDAWLNLLYMCDFTWPTIADATGSTYNSSIITNQQTAQRLCRAATEALHGAGVSWTFQVGYGTVGEGLLRYADDLGADAVMIGRSHKPGRSRIARRLLGHGEHLVIVVP